MARILVVDDDVKMVDVLAALLAIDGHEPITAHDGHEALITIGREHPDLTILDMDLPRLDGEEVLRTLNTAGSAMPVIVLTGQRVDEADEVKLLELGAVDFIRKGTNAPVILARVDAALREKLSDPTRILRRGSVALDISRAKVTVGGRSVALSSQNIRLLALLMSVHHVVTKDEIASEVLGSNNHLYDHAVEQAVHQLRRSLGARPIIRTVRGRGYEFNSP